MYDAFDDSFITCDEMKYGLLLIIKCMCSRCRRDDIHVCFAYASPQRMPHMYDHKTVSLKYII